MKKGISIVSLTIVIIIMIILAGIVIITGIDSANTTTATAYALELLNIQTAVDEYYYRYNEYPVTTDITLNISDIDSNYLYQFEEEQIIENSIKFKALDIAKIGINDLEYGNFEQSKDVYVLSETTGKVYYLLGIEYEEKTHYTLTDELYELLDIYPSKFLTETEIKKYDVIFEVSNLKYTSNPITVNVKLPIDATLNNITTTDSKSVSEAVKIDGYNVITINKTSQIKEGNYGIEVNYTYNGVTKTANYDITNFDNTIPQIIVDEAQSDDLVKLTIHAVDNESGVEHIKYELGNVQDKSYFEHYGKILNGNIIFIKPEEECTIYVEDKAGNSEITVINLKDE